MHYPQNLGGRLDSRRLHQFENKKPFSFGAFNFFPPKFRFPNAFPDKLLVSLISRRATTFQLASCPRREIH
jgi:hypothetical protein